MTEQEIESLIREIEGWEEGYQIETNWVNDGEHHQDFMGFRVTECGRKKLRELFLTEQKKAT